MIYLHSIQHVPVWQKGAPLLLCFSCEGVWIIPPARTRVYGCRMDSDRAQVSSLRPHKQSGPLTEMPRYFLIISPSSRTNVSYHTNTASHHYLEQLLRVPAVFVCHYRWSRSPQVVDLLYHLVRLPGLPGTSRMRRGDSMTHGWRN